MRLNSLEIFKESSFHIMSNFKNFFVFSFINYILLMAVEFFGGFEHPSSFLFLPLLYLLWVSFFRIYFKEKPVFDLRATLNSLNPSAKIILYMFAFAVAWIFFTIMLGFFGYPIDFLERYMDKSNITNMVLLALFALISPYVLFRPYFAWIGSVINKNASLSFAYAQTKNNYFGFLFIFVFINSIAFFVETLIPNVWISYFVLSLICTYFNIVLAKSYEFFFKV